MALYTPIRIDVVPTLKFTPTPRRYGGSTVVSHVFVMNGWRMLWVPTPNQTPYFHP